MQKDNRLRELSDTKYNIHIIGSPERKKEAVNLKKTQTIPKTGAGNSQEAQRSPTKVTEGGPHEDR